MHQGVHLLLSQGPFRLYHLILSAQGIRYHNVSPSQTMEAHEYLHSLPIEESVRPPDWEPLIWSISRYKTIMALLQNGYCLPCRWTTMASRPNVKARSSWWFMKSWEEERFPLPKGHSSPTFLPPNNIWHVEKEHKVSKVRFWHHLT